MTRKPWSGMVTGALLVAAVGLGLHLFTVGSGLVRLSYDLLMVARPALPVEEVVMIYLDEESHRALDQPFNAPWDRALHARLIRRLTAAGAKAVALDIIFSDPNPAEPAADQELAEAIRQNGQVVLAADHVPVGPHTKQFVPPFDLLLDGAAGLGSAEVLPDRDMVIRRHTPEDLLPSLSWAVAEVAGAAAVRDPGTAQASRWINYYGPANHLPQVSYHAALDPQAVPDEVFRNKVVFVGARILTRFAGERKDEYRTPFTFWSQENLFISGVEIQATGFLNLLRGDWLRRWPVPAESLALVLAGLVFGAGLVCFRPAAAVGLTLATALGTVLVGYTAFSFWGIWFPWVLCIVQIGLSLSWSVLFNLVQLYVQKRLIEQTLAVYLPPKLVRKFSRDPQLLQPGAHKQELTIMFTDIAGFTTLSEGLDSDDLATMMNQYFERAVSGCIHQTGGTVGKYIGDAILAFWNAPDRQEDHALRACQAALLFREGEKFSSPDQAFVTRMGIHTGVANVGNFGSTQRVDYTVLGESVNLASRLEGLNRFLGTYTLMSGETRSQVDHRMVTRRVGRFRLKGFQKPVEAHELVGGPHASQPTRAWRERFEQAWQDFAEKRFDAASEGFRQVCQLKSQDGPSLYYLEQIPLVRSRDLPASWQGEIDLLEK